MGAMCGLWSVLIRIVKGKGRDCDGELSNITILVNKTLYTFSHLMQAKYSGDAVISELQVATSEMWRSMAATHGNSCLNPNGVQGTKRRLGHG